MEMFQNFDAKLFCAARVQCITRGGHQGQRYYVLRLSSAAYDVFLKNKGYFLAPQMLIAQPQTPILQVRQMLWAVYAGHILCVKLLWLF